MPATTVVYRYPDKQEREGQAIEELTVFVSSRETTTFLTALRRFIFNLAIEAICTNIIKKKIRYIYEGDYWLILRS